jgi:hypothetical protein
MASGPMNRTRRSLYYLAGYLIPTGLAFYFAPQWFMKLLFSNRQYDDAFPQFTGILLVGLGIVVLTVIKYGNPVFYRMTLIVRVVLWLGILGIYLKNRDPLFIVVLCVLGFGMLLTGSIYLSERRKSL